MGAGIDREKSLERQIRAFHWVRLLAELPAREAGSADEREAAARVGAWLSDVGVEDVDRVPIATRPRPALVLALHLGLGALAAWWGGGLGALLGGLVAVSFRRDLGGGGLLLSRWLPAPASQNVVGRARARHGRRRIVLSAHIDTTRAGWLFSPRWADFFARLARPRAGRGRAPAGPYALPQALLWASALLSLGGWLGAGGFVFGLARVLAVAALLAGCGLAVQWARAEPTPGANDDASGVAAMLTCAEQLLADLPPDVELWVVGTGAEEVGCCGMRALLDAHPGWSADTTWFVNFECVGGGALHYVRSEGTLARTGHPPLLLELARRVAAGGACGAVTPADLLAATDGHVPAERGYAVLSLISLEAGGIPRHYHRREDLPEHVDTETLVRAADFGAAVARVALRGEAEPIAIV